MTLQQRIEALELQSKKHAESITAVASHMGGDVAKHVGEILTAPEHFDIETGSIDPPASGN